MSRAQSSVIGPVLFLDAIEGGLQHLSALFIAPGDDEPPPVEHPGGTVRACRLAGYDRASVWRARFALPADRTSAYVWNGTAFEVAGDLTGDLRMAYVSCNGEEVGDMDRAESERNAMWERLRAEHRRAPFALILHGGDQIYADEVTQGHPLSED